MNVNGLVVRRSHCCFFADEGMLSPETLLVRWGARDFCEPCWKALLRAASTAGLSEVPACWREDEIVSRRSRRPVYLALSGPELLEAGVRLDPFLQELRGNWTGEDAAIWLQREPGESPRLVAVLRPDGAGRPYITWL